MTLGPAQIVVALVALQRLGELAYARRNEHRLRARGGVEHGARHYPLMVVLHAGWLAAIFALVPADAPVLWPLLALYAGLQLARVWTVRALGPDWTTRVIELPGAPRVRRGPYRYLRHPNYAIVAAEIAVLPAAFGAWTLAAVFTLANAALLARRIRVEDAALASRDG